MSANILNCWPNKIDSTYLKRNTMSIAITAMDNDLIKGLVCGLFFVLFMGNLYLQNFVTSLISWVNSHHVSACYDLVNTNSPRTD